MDKIEIGNIITRISCFRGTNQHLIGEVGIVIDESARKFRVHWTHKPADPTGKRMRQDKKSWIVKEWVTQINKL